MNTYINLVPGLDYIQEYKFKLPYELILSEAKIYAWACGFDNFRYTFARSLEDAKKYLPHCHIITLWK